MMQLHCNNYNKMKRGDMIPIKDKKGMVVLAHVNILDNILPPEIDKQGSTSIRERDTRKAKKEANKMKSLQLMNLANIRGNTRAKSTMSRHQSEHEVFLLYLYKHEDQLLGPEMLAQIRYIFLEREVCTGLHPIKFEDFKPTDFAKYLGTLSNPVTGCLLSQKMYKNKKTSLYNLFKKYKMK